MWSSRSLCSVHVFRTGTPKLRVPWTNCRGGAAIWPLSVEVSQGPAQRLSPLSVPPGWSTRQSKGSRGVPTCSEWGPRPLPPHLPPPRVGVSGSPPERRGRYRRRRAGPERGSARRKASAGAAGTGRRGLGAWRAAVHRAGRGGGGHAASERAGGEAAVAAEELGAAPRSSMALPGSPEPPHGAPRKAPSLLEMGALCLDSEIILGFTSHLLRRRAKVRARRQDPAGGRGAVPRLCGASPAAQGAAPGRKSRF